MSRIGGYLAGFGIARADGSTTDFVWLDEPIHNRIVSGGLDHMMMYNGDPIGCYESNFDNTNGFYCGHIGDHYGVLEFCAYGDGTGVTGFTDTDLHGRLVEPYSTRFTGVPYNGTRVDKADFADDDNIITVRYRVSHQSPKVTETTTIRELGWYGRRGSGESMEYVLFSRILLDTPITLYAGESLISTYELHEKVDCTLRTVPAEAFGIYNSAHPVYALPIVGANVIGSWDTIVNRPYIKIDGTQGNAYDGRLYYTSPSGTVSSCVYPIWYSNSGIDLYYRNVGEWCNFISNMWDRLTELQGKLVHVRPDKTGSVYDRFPSIPKFPMFGQTVPRFGVNATTIVDRYQLGSHKRSRTIHFFNFTSGSGSHSGSDTQAMVMQGTMYFFHSDETSGESIPVTVPINIVETQTITADTE